MPRRAPGAPEGRAAGRPRKYAIPVTVRNFQVPGSPGTPAGAPASSSDVDRATAIVDQPSLVIFDIESDNPRLSLQIAERLERVRLTFFQVSTKEAGTRAPVRPLKYGSVDSIIRHVLAERQVSAEINASDFALVSVVGEAGPRQLDHGNAQAERVLADNGIDIHGAARDDISLSYLVPEEHRKKAVSALHKALVL